MRVTTQMLNETARKAGLPINNQHCLIILIMIVQQIRCLTA